MSYAAVKRANRYNKYAPEFRPQRLSDWGDVAYETNDVTLTEVITARRGSIALILSRTCMDMDAPIVAELERWRGDTITSVAGPLAYPFEAYHHAHEDTPPNATLDEELFADVEYVDSWDWVARQAFVDLMPELALREQAIDVYAANPTLTVVLAEAVAV